MNSREYWERRALLRKVQAERSALRTADEIGEAYDRAAASLQKDISYWLSRFAQNNSLSLTDAKKLLKADELKEFRWTVEEYISHGEQNADGRWAKQLETPPPGFTSPAWRRCGRCSERKRKHFPARN